MPIAPSTYYDQANREPSRRPRRVEALKLEIGRVHAANYGVYGARKVWLTLNREGIDVARCTVERLMDELGLSGATRGKARETTIADPAAARPADLVQRRFGPPAPNRLWVADLIYVSTWSGFAYVAFVTDAYARRILGWRVASTMATSMVLDAIEQAIWTRRQEGVLDLKDVVHQTDRGSQGGFNWSSQHLELWRCQMGRPAGWMTTLTGRPAMRSPGCPPIRRDVERAFWVKIAGGLTSEDAAVACGVSGPVGSRWFRERGGMPSIQLTALSGRYLSFVEREEIALLKAQDHGVREIARRVGRSPSTISRELRRNAATRGGYLAYRASIAQWKAELMARRPKTAKLAVNAVLRQYVADRLAGMIRRPDGSPVPGPATAQWKGRNKAHRQDRRWATAWSPEQIAHRLPIDFPDDESMRISHEAIYRSLYVQGRGALRRELVACLRTGRALRVPRARARQRANGHVTDEVMISARPAEAADRAVPGHWESQWCCQAA